MTKGKKVSSLSELFAWVFGSKEASQESEEDNQLKADLTELANESKALEDENIRLKADLESRDKEIKELKAQNENLAKEAKELKAQNEQLEKDVATMSKEPVTDPTLAEVKDDQLEVKSKKKIWETAAHNPHLN